MNAAMVYVGGGVLATLIAATGTGVVLHRTAASPEARSWSENFSHRTRAWWFIAAALAAALALGSAGVVVLFGSASCLALREFVTLLPTQRADHRALLWAFYVIIPLQYLLVATGPQELFLLFLPMTAFLLMPALVAVGGEAFRFTERAAGLQWGLMACVYGVSFAPALLRLDGTAGGSGTQLLAFLLLVVAASDVSQYAWGKLIGRRQLAPRISPKKTWEGLIGGLLSAPALGAAFWWLTPFAAWQSGAVAFAIAGLGVLGGLTMSAIKRERGVKDFGNLVSGHGGVLDRIDSLCFAAPAFFFICRVAISGGL